MKRTVLVLLLAAVVAGCGSDGEPVAAGDISSAHPAAAVDPGVVAELVGTTWTVTGFMDGDSTVSIRPPGGRSGFLRFEDNRFVTGHDGCNGFGYSLGAGPNDEQGDLGLTYEIVEDRIILGGASVSTLQACGQEDYGDRFRAVLTGTVTYEIEGSKLTLMTSEGRGVSYTAEA